MTEILFARKTDVDTVLAALPALAALATADFVTLTAQSGLGNEQVVASSTSIALNTATPGTIAWERAALIGDITAPANSNTTTLATVNANVGTFGTASNVGQFTVNGKGLITAAVNVPIAISSGNVSDFSEAVQDLINSSYVNSATINIGYNDPANTYTFSVNTNSITDALLRQGTALSVIGRSANSLGNVADIVAGADGNVLRRSGATIGFGQINIADGTNAVTGRLAFANFTQGTARSVLGVTGNAGADFANIQGTSDQVLVINTAGTALTFGTVATGGIANQAVTYAKIQNISATSRVLGRVTAGAGSTEELTVSQVLDFVGAAANGDILSRQAGTWNRLGIGATDQVLKVVSALPAWVYENMHIAGGRVTLQTGVPVMTTTQAAKTTVFYAPYLSQIIPIYDGTNITMRDFGGELSQATTDATKSPAAVANNSNYDIFVWNDAGTFRATRGPAWTSDTARGTGAGTTELVRVKGVLLNNVAITNGPAAQRGTYVGSVRSNGSAQIDWIYGALAASGTAGVFGVWNMYNRMDVRAFVQDSTDSYTYTTATIRAANGSNTMRVSFIQGLAEDAFSASYTANSTNNASNAAQGRACGIGYDVTNAFSSGGTTGYCQQTAYRAADAVTNVVVIEQATGHYRNKGDLGFHFTQACEYSDAGGATSTWFPDGGAPTVLQSGLTFEGKF